MITFRMKIFLESIQKLQLLEYESIDTELLKENGVYELFVLILEKSCYGHTVSEFDIDYFYCPILEIIYELTIFEINLFDFENSKIKFNLLYDKLNHVIENEKMTKKLLDYLNGKKYTLLKTKKYLDQEPHVIENECNIDLSNINIIFSLIGESMTRNNFKETNKLIQILDENSEINSRINKLKEHTNLYAIFYENEDDTTLLSTIEEIRKNLKRILFLNVDKHLLDSFIIIKELNILNILRIKKKQHLFFDCKIDLPTDNIYYKLIKHVVDVNYFTNIYATDGKPYFNYLNKLITEKYIHISKSLFSEYMTLLFKEKKYTECVVFYNQYKNVFAFIIKSSCNPMIKINVALHVIKSNHYNNTLITCKEITDIISGVDFSNIKLTENYVRVLDYILKTKKSLENIEELILDRGFKLKYINNMDINENDMCLICHEIIEQNIITTVECQGCKNEIGHMKCVLQWFTSSTSFSCPNCRFHK